jgi:hypothetical protein
MSTSTTGYKHDPLEGAVVDGGAAHSDVGGGGGVRFPAERSNPLHIVEGGPARKDLELRREVKYALPDADPGTIRTVLKGNCKSVKFGKGPSRVRSIYFDDHRLTACYENLYGISSRRKLRIRWYDRPLPGESFFFEIKWREGRITGKHRLEMRSEHPVEDMEFSDLAEYLMGVLPAEHRRFVLKYAEPVALVEYKREHFVTRDRAVRATLDYDLVFYPQMGRRKPSLRFGQRMENMVVLEGKSPVGREREVLEMFHPMRPRATRSSKYVNACKALGFVSPTE